jgi:hypothetical protein
MVRGRLPQMMKVIWEDEFIRPEVPRKDNLGFSLGAYTRR